MKKITLHEMFGIGKNKDLIKEQIINSLLAYTDSFYSNWERLAIAMVVCDFLESNSWDDYHYGQEIDTKELSVKFSIFLMNQLGVELEIDGGEK